MKRTVRNGLVVILFALIIGAAALGYAAYTSREQQRMAVVVAATDLEPGLVVSAEMLGQATVMRPEPGDPAQYVLTADQVVGRYVLQGFLQGQPLDMRGFGEPPVAGRPMVSGLVIPPTGRGLPVPTDLLLSVGGTVKAGDRLTILVGNPDWAAVQNYLDAVAALKPAGSQTMPASTAPEVPAPGAAATTAEERYKVELPLSVNPIPLSWTVFLESVQVVELRTVAGESLVRQEAKAGETGAAVMVLEVTAEQARRIEWYIYMNRAVFLLEGPTAAPAPATP